MENESKSWVGCDLDGTLATYDHWRGIGHIGDPIPLMVARVKAWLKKGQEVRIFTARIGSHNDELTNEHVKLRIEEWCKLHLGRSLRITNEKDFMMIELWDDRAVQVEPNTGRRVDGRK